MKRAQQYINWDVIIHLVWKLRSWDFENLIVNIWKVSKLCVRYLGCVIQTFYTGTYYYQKLIIFSPPLQTADISSMEECGSFLERPNFLVFLTSSLSIYLLLNFRNLGCEIKKINNKSIYFNTTILQHSWCGRVSSKLSSQECLRHSLTFIKYGKITHIKHTL